MLKLIAIFLVTILVAVHCEIKVGEYHEHPELLEDSIMKSLVRYVNEDIAKTKNLHLENVKITRILTQVVTGINYVFDFTGESTKGTTKGKLIKCNAAIFVNFDLSITINQVDCKKA